MLFINYLLLPPDSLLSSTDLITCRAIALQKCTEDLTTLHDHVLTVRNRAAVRFEHEHSTTICNFDFKPRALVLIRNTAIEKSLNRKMRPHYNSPVVIVSRNHGGAYIICKLNGTLAQSPIAAFCILPYFTRNHIDIPDIEEHINVTVAQLREMEDSAETGDGSDDLVEQDTQPADEEPKRED